MTIELSNGKQIQILGINLRNSTVDFKWVDGVYGGECSFPMGMSEGIIPNATDIAAAAEAFFVAEEVVGGE